MRIRSPATGSATERAAPPPPTPTNAGGHGIRLRHDRSTMLTPARGIGRAVAAAAVAAASAAVVPAAASPLLIANASARAITAAAGRPTVSSSPARGPFAVGETVVRFVDARRRVRFPGHPPQPRRL